MTIPHQASEDKVFPAQSTTKNEYDRQLPKDRMNFKIPSNHMVRQHMHNHYGSESWRSRTLHFLHSKNVELFLMALLLVDVLILFVEMFLLAEYPPCDQILQDAVSCCPAAIVVLDEESNAHRYVKESAAHNEELCASGLEPSYEYEAGCDESNRGAVHLAEEFMFAGSITILSIFILELMVTMVAMKPQIFFRQFFFLLDFVIVAVSMALELTFYFLDESKVQSIIGLLVAGRIWRFIRIGHGIAEVTHEFASEDYQKLYKYAVALELCLRENGVDVPHPEILRRLKPKTPPDVVEKIDDESQNGTSQS